MKRAPSRAAISSSVLVKRAARSWSKLRWKLKMERFLMGPG